MVIATVPATSVPTADEACAPTNRLGVTWRVSLGLLAVQLVAMLVFTTVQYRRFNLTTDFAAYSQAWTAIAHGHLNPYSSVFGQLYWRNDFELLMWPLALFYWVYPHSVTLLWLQVLAVVGGELVVLSWAREIVARTDRDGTHSAKVLGLVTALLVLTPWSWYTIGFDFHFEPFLAVFALLAARDLWAGRRRAWLWAAMTLLCGAAPGSLCLIAVGLAGSLTRRGAHAKALAIAGTGCAWLVLASGLGAMGFRGETLGTMYGYLTNNPAGHIGMAQVAVGLMVHPGRALSMFWSHIGYVAGYTVSGGVIGLRSRWALVPAGFVLLPSALNADTNFIHFAQAFQSWPAVLFLVAGTALGLQAPGVRASSPHGVLVLGAATALAAAAVLVTYAGHIPTYLERVSPTAAAELDQLQRSIPPDAEVVASQGIIGRFGVGRTAYSYWAYGSPESFPVSARGAPVVFVLSPLEGTAEGYATETRQSVRYLITDLHARPLVEGRGIWSFVWSPPLGTRSVTLP